MRDEVLAALEEKEPGIQNRLIAEWSLEFRKVVMSYVTHAKAELVLAACEKNRRRHTSGYVLLHQIVERHVFVMVRVYQSGWQQVAGKRVPLPVEKDVALFFDLRHPDGRVMVFAESKLALQALKIFLAWLYDQTVDSVPWGESGMQSQLRHTHFQETDIIKIAQRHGWSPTCVAGEPPTGEHGLLKIEGKQHEDGRLPLDFSVAYVHAQNRQDNKERWYQFVYAHADRFKESVEVHFHFSSKPHLSFTTSPSKSAFDFVMSLIWELQR
jgi:hypothetical protein